MSRALRAANTDTPALVGRLLDVEDSGTLTIEVAGTDHVLWNHDPDRLRELAERSAGEVLLQPEWSVLRIRTGCASSYAFNVAEHPRTRGECST